LLENTFSGVIIACLLTCIGKSLRPFLWIAIIATNCEPAGIGAAIGGPTGHLLEHNTQVIAQIRANLAACKVNLCLSNFNIAWYHSYVNKQISCNTHCCVW
jgi:hypothetical protein